MKEAKKFSRKSVGSLLLATGFFTCFCAVGVGAISAQAEMFPEAGSYEPSDESAFETIFKKYYPNTPCKDALTVLNETGITIRYSIIEFPTEYRKSWRFSGKGYERHTPSGPYLVRLEAGKDSVMQKVMLLK